LGDFGFARLIGESEGLKLSVGTVAYMAVKKLHSHTLPRTWTKVQVFIEKCESIDASISEVISTYNYLLRVSV